MVTSDRDEIGGMISIISDEPAQSYNFLVNL